MVDHREHNAREEPSNVRERVDSALTLRAIIGLGANLGPRLATMRAATKELGRATRIERTSHVYASPALGGPPDQPDFLNAAALVSFEGEPDQLMATLIEIETRLGRVRRERWGPRTIDLDLLWIDGIAIDSPALVVPHPSLRERDFALAPMLELVPDARDPRTGEPYAVPAGGARRTEAVL
jgi:2-amino-4-hydroxy-6-hydroxymethyldihydropteridine diphosphokinase